VRSGLRHLAKTVALTEPICVVVLQGHGHHDTFAALVSLIDDVAQDSAADPAILLRRLDLKLANFDSTVLIQYLDHTHAFSIHLDEREVPALPALACVTNVTCLIPRTEGLDEEISVDAASQSIEPTLVVRGYAK
jgi:hypothetical protein